MIPRNSEAPSSALSGGSRGTLSQITIFERTMESRGGEAGMENADLDEQACRTDKVTGRQSR